MEHVDISLVLETSFRKHTVETKFKRDCFQHRPTETIQDGLSYLTASGKIKESLGYLLEYYDFGVGDLKTILDDNSNRDKIFDLIKYVDEL